MKKKITVSLAFAIITCLLIAAVAVAAERIGIMNFNMERWGSDMNVLPEASDIVQEDIAHNAAHTGSAMFSVREAIFDGQFGYVVVDVTSKEEGAILLGLDSDPSMPVSDFGFRFSDDERTIGEYARDIGSKRLIHTGVLSSLQSDIDFDFLDYLVEEDGTQVYTITGAYVGDGDEAAVELICSTYDYIEVNGEYKDDYDDSEKATISFTLKAADIIGAALCESPVEFSNFGVRVDWVKLTATPMAVYTEVCFTVIDEGKFDAIDGMLWFNFLDENGEQIPLGAPSGGEMTPTDESKTRFVQKDSFAAMNALPETIMLRGYIPGEMDRCETHEIALK